MKIGLTQINKFGTYKLIIDTIPPKISKIGNNDIKYITSHWNLK